MRKRIIWFLVLIILSVYSFAQSVQLNKKGLIVFNKPSFKYFAVLMQDTTLSGNRFDNWFDAPEKNEYWTNPKGNIILPALLVDSALFFKCEERLLTRIAQLNFILIRNIQTTTINWGKMLKSIFAFILVILMALDIRK